MKPVKRVFLVALLLQMCSFAAQSSKGTIVSVYNKRVGPCRIEQAGVYHALAEISTKTNIPIGVEAVLPTSEPNIVINFPGGTAADLLNALVALAPDYTWSETEQGIVHVSRGGAHITLLDVVMSYPGADNKTRQQIWEDLANRPEISAWMNSADCTRGELFQGGEFKAHNAPISIPPGEITVRQLLDEVLLKSGQNYWAVLQSASSTTSCRIAILLW